METAKLAPVGIPADSDRKGSKVNMIVVGKLFSEKDESGAGGQHRQSVPDFFLKCLKHIQFLQKFSLNGAFTSGKDQAIDRDI